MNSLRYRSGRGAFDAETAIVLATVIVLIVPVWNVIVSLLSRHAIALAVNLYLINPQPKPLSALTESEGVPGLDGLSASVSILSTVNSELFLVEFQDSIISSLASVGFPTKQSRFSVISALYYINIDASTGRVSLNSEWNDKHFLLAATKSVNSPNFNLKCGTATEDTLKAYAENKLNILSPNNGYTKSIGTQLISTDSSSVIKEYLPYRGLIFTSISACAPSLWTSPVEYQTFIIPSKEVGIY